jgi:hypothetical protein
MKACSIYKVPIDLEMMILNMTILKMNFNFKFKDMLAAARASMWELTNGCDSHHTEKYGIKRAGSSGLAESSGFSTPHYRNEARCTGNKSDPSKRAVAIIRKVLKAGSCPNVWHPQIIGERV